MSENWTWILWTILGVVLVIAEVFTPGFVLLWFGIGKEDAGLANSHATADLLKKHGFNPVFHESEGGHTWPNWRDYLVIFAPQLF